MRKHLKQIAAYKDPARFKFLLAGRRGGKSELIIEDISRSASIMPPKSKLFYIGPTNQMAMEIIWERLEERFYKNKWKFRDLKSSQRFEFSHGRSVQVIGAEKIRRVRGQKLFKAYLDEVAFFDSDLFNVWRAVRPALSDLTGKAILATTPNGKGTQAYDFYLSIINSPDWAFHHWRTLDNPAISEEEVEAAKRELDEKSFKQEYEASWESYEGLAYYAFNENIHIKKQPAITDQLPLILHFDFNVNPTTLVLAQRYPDMYRFKKEYSFKNSSTIATVKAFTEEFYPLKDRLQLKIRGDSSGYSRASTTGFADYHYIKEQLASAGFNFQMEVPGANPPIVDRVQHMNSYLMPVGGEHKVEFDPSMADTIRDFSSQVLEGRFPSDKNNLGHKADAVSYGVYWDWLHTRPVARSSMIQL